MNRMLQNAQGSATGYIRPEFRFGNDLLTNSGSFVNNDANACLGFCIDIAGFSAGMDLSVPLGLHTCKSAALTGGLSHALDQRFTFEGGNGAITFDVAVGECVPGSNCPADWVLPLQKCAEIVGNEVYLKDCDGSPAQKFTLKTSGSNQGRLKQGNNCLAAIDMEAQTTNCFANFPCAFVDLSQCTSSNSFPYAGSGGNACHQYIGLEVVTCNGSDDDLSKWLVGEDPIGFPDFCG